MSQSSQMSCAQFRRNDQVDQFPADSSFARVTEKTLSCDIPFTHAAVVADDDDAIECGIEDCLAVLFAGGEIVLLFACELLDCCGNEIVEERMNERLGFSPRRGIEFLDIASESVKAITCNYLPHASQFANDLLDLVSRLPTMLRLRVALSLVFGSARLSFFFESLGQVLAERREIISKLLPRRISGKCQLGLPPAGLAPLLNHPLRTIGEKTAKLHQWIHVGTQLSVFDSRMDEQVPCYLPAKDDGRLNSDLLKG